MVTVNQKPVFIICQHLKVYKDMALGDNGEFVDTGISNAECLKYKKNEPCPKYGKCILARESYTWRIVNRKSWGK